MNCGSEFVYFEVRPSQDLTIRSLSLFVVMAANMLQHCWLHFAVPDNRNKQPEPHDTGKQKAGQADNRDTVPAGWNVG